MGNTLTFELKFKDPYAPRWRTRNYILAASALKAASDLAAKGWSVQLWSVTRLKLAIAVKKGQHNVQN